MKPASTHVSKPRRTRDPAPAQPATVAKTIPLVTAKGDSAEAFPVQCSGTRHKSADIADDPVTRHWLSRLETLAQPALSEFIQRQRWYPAKNSDTPGVELSALLPLAVSGVPSALAVWQVTPPGQSPIHLFVPLALVPDEQADPAQVIAADTSDGSGGMRVVEAFSVDAFVRAWIDLLLGGGGESRNAARIPKISRS